MGIVLPEAVFGMPTYEYVVTHLRKTVKIRGIISMPESLFKTSGKGGTHAKTCVLFLENTSPKPDEDWDIFMADAKWCGHDSRGNPTIRKDATGKEMLLDDIPLVTKKFKGDHRLMVSFQQDHLGFVLPNSKIRNGVFIPKFYNPELSARLRKLKTTHQLLSIKDLKDEGHLSVATGDEIGKMAYGTGEIPFIRTSDIVNWEVKADPKHGVSEEIYAAYSVKQDVRAGDIFLVRDGTYLIGQACLLTNHDLPCLYQSHILKFRLNEASPISLYLFLACLNSPIVKQQIRANQFTADIIDTVGNRYLDLVLPVPQKKSLRDRISNEVRLNVTQRIDL